MLTLRSQPASHSDRSNLNIRMRLAELAERDWPQNRIESGVAFRQIRCKEIFGGKRQRGS